MNKNLEPGKSELTSEELEVEKTLRPRPGRPCSRHVIERFASLFCRFNKYKTDYRQSLVAMKSSTFGRRVFSTSNSSESEF